MTVNLSMLAGAAAQFLDNSGNVLTGGKIYTYAAGTTTNQATYTSNTGLVAHTNPIILDAAGRVPGGEIWLTDPLLYKFVVKDSADVLIGTYDNISGANDTTQVNLFKAELANSSDPTKGDALVGFRQSNSSGNLTGTVGRTVHQKLQEFVSVLDFGAVGNGITDDTAAIQAAINAFKPASGSTPVTGNVIFFPKGNYLINAAIKTYSGITLLGVGAASILTAGPSLTTQVIELASLDASLQYRYANVENLAIVTTGSVWAIKSTAGLVLNSTIKNIVLRSTYGISVCEPNTYTQDCIIDGVYSTGSIEQIISLSGNFNTVQNINKEGNTGTNTDPYIYIWSNTLGAADANNLRKILLEGSGSANKTPIKFLNSDSIIEDYWMEASTTNGYLIDLDASTLQSTGAFRYLTSGIGKVKLRNSSNFEVDYFGSGSEDLDWQTYVDADSSSTFYANTISGRRANDVYKVNNSKNFIVQKYFNDTLGQTPVAGYSPYSLPNYTSGQNLLINPSFEAGLYGWSFSGATPTFVASEVGQGLMFKSTGASAGGQLLQSVNISASQIGQPLTLRYMCKAVSTGFVVPYIAGDAQFAYNRVTSENGWVSLTVTYRPSTSGALTFGLWYVGTSGAANELYVDEMSLSCGEQGVLNPSKFGSFELNQKTFTSASAAPVDGTWKVGDHVFNSAPAVGSPKGWVCTVAGTPGTWVSEGNL